MLTKCNITGLTEEEKDHWDRVWHRLKPWPDSIPGLTRLKKKYTIAPLSNGNFAMLTNMAKNAGLPWDCILSAELARHFKYDREAYLTAVELLGLKPGDVMMGAAHTNDLKAARSFGLLTGHIDRPIENDKANPGDFDVVAKDMVDFAVATRRVKPAGWLSAWNPASRGSGTLCVYGSSCRAACSSSSCGHRRLPAPQVAGVVLFEGARLITADGGAPIENSRSWSRTGGSRSSAGEDRCRCPAGPRVDLTGRPSCRRSSNHGHLGYRRANNLVENYHA